MNRDTVKGKAKETEGELQQQWGKLKEKTEETYDRAKDKVGEMRDDDGNDDARDREDRPADENQDW